MRPCRHLRPFITRACRVSVCAASCFSALIWPPPAPARRDTNLPTSSVLAESQTAARSISISFGISDRRSAPATTTPTAIPAYSPTTQGPFAHAARHALPCRGVPSFRSKLALYRVYTSSKGQAAHDWINLSSCPDVSLAPIATANRQSQHARLKLHWNNRCRGV